MLPNQNVPETNCLPEWLSALEGQPTAWLIRLYAKPGAKKNQIVGEFAGSLKIAIHAPPEEGRANRALLAYLAQILDLPKRDLIVLQGETSRHKTVKCFGATRQQILALLPATPENIG